MLPTAFAQGTARPEVTTSDLVGVHVPASVGRSGVVNDGAIVGTVHELSVPEVATPEAAGSPRSVKPNTVLGTDERVRVSPADQHIALLELTSSNGDQYLCTGTFVGAQVLVTAGHCIWEMTYGGYLSSIRVVPGRDGNSEPHSAAWAASVWVPETWVESGAENSYYDWGVIYLDSPALGNSVGWYQMGALTDETLQGAYNPTITGYPGDQAYGTQWRGERDSLLEVLPYELAYEIDTAGGQSGSGVTRGSDNVLTGIHWGGGVTSNYANRVDAEMLEALDGACAEMGCTIDSFIEDNGPGPNPDAALAFQRTWQRTDQPVAAGAVSRTWMWGPQANTGLLREEYAESPDGERTVVYYDKSRMEITQPDGQVTSEWYVTNGLLALELMTGNMQVGDNEFIPRNPAQVNVAGDQNDPNGPTYATFNGLRDDAALGAGAAITWRVNRNGTVTNDPLLAGRGVTAASWVNVPGISHQVASPFWAFMNSTGLVSDNGILVNALLFSNPFYATGYPLTEAYWATVQIGGTPRDVLMQCFERRCLTYTPENPAGWQVEAGNIGQHYFLWRADDGPGPQPQCDPAYPDFCIAPPPPNLNCADVAPNVNFTVLAPDPHGFDVDGDGIGCESGPIDPAVPVEGDVVLTVPMMELGDYVSPDGDILAGWVDSLGAYVVSDTSDIVGDNLSGFYLWFDNDPTLPEDYSVTTDIVTLTYDTTYDSSVGLYYRLENDANDPTRYAATDFGMDGEIGSAYVLPNDVVEVQPYVPASEFNAGYGAINQLKVVVQGAHVWVLLNGVLQHEFDLPAGSDTDATGFAFVTYRFGNSSDETAFGFQNLVVREIP